LSANRSRIEELFDHFVDRLLDVVKPDGSGNISVPEAAYLNVIRQFLKENSMSADADRHDGLRELRTRANHPFAEEPSEDDL
jgi:hypothetical protein